MCAASSSSAATEGFLKSFGRSFNVSESDGVVNADGPMASMLRARQRDQIIEDKSPSGRIV